MVCSWYSHPRIDKHGIFQTVFSCSNSSAIIGYAVLLLLGGILLKSKISHIYTDLGCFYVSYSYSLVLQ